MYFSKQVSYLNKGESCTYSAPSSRCYADALIYREKLWLETGPRCPVWYKPQEYPAKTTSMSS